VDIALWVAQAVRARVVPGAGFRTIRTGHLTRATGSPANSSFVEDLSEPTFTTIGVFELVGACGVLLPRALDVAPAVTPLPPSDSPPSSARSPGTCAAARTHPSCSTSSCSCSPVVARVGRGLEVMS
jgi:hypothetical protein